MGNLISIKNLQVDFKQDKDSVKVVKGIDISMDKGEVLAIVGESGSGKSVSMKALMDILPENGKAYTDEMLFDGRELKNLTTKEKRLLRGNEIAMIFQDPMTALNPLKTVGAHLVEVIKRHHKISTKEAKDEAIEMLKKVGIPSPEKRLKQYPHEFSGGMRQRVLIAMALCSKPKLLIADEPTTALDVTIQAQILKLLKSLHETEGMDIILITHDLGVVASIADRIAVMNSGEIVEVGTKEEILYSPKHAYTKALLKAIPKCQKGERERLIQVDNTYVELARA
ncbi:oligopeptide transport system ATP-binding protein [Pseudobutyrivibrio sp. UC1225]|uniref:ABC transporter ATP-binding protein n=1 Tax=Pseudobutyrivibrio sp. UC1225 TaxID=1798185 RepID=UPI0008F115A0|nr:ABC transporter ATP-binding protein [Pseudobutyrivibrio sp. UC1225]SFO23101.1 oligopeptide transport system ATP-binding protein [Pseudobutyrivibrio sp. UC1225]